MRNQAVYYRVDNRRPYDEKSSETNIASWIRNASREARSYSSKGSIHRRDPNVDLGDAVDREKYIFASHERARGLDTLCATNYSEIEKLLTTYASFPVAQPLAKLKRGYDAWIKHRTKSSK